jgi:phosphoribosylamine--glycine ligase
MMRIAIVGSGGREHALGWKLRLEDAGHRLDFLPGNGGTSAIGTNVDIAPGDIGAVVAWAAKTRPDLVIVGPEDPLAGGLADRLAEAGVAVFGPTQAAARIESSKVFAKDFMSRHGIPTPPYKVFTSAAKAHAHVEKHSGPLVVKADGLARGKGAMVTKSRAQAHEAVEMVLTEKAFGAAGESVLIEERLRGEEASVVAVTDGECYVVLPPAQDHKQVFDRDRGPNTGGMGSYSPAPLVDRAALKRIETAVLKKLLRGLEREGLDYRGVVYAGLMMNDEGVFVIEFNARFGDPETQAMLAATDAAVGPLMAEAAAGRLGRNQILSAARWAVCVVAASGGYPGPYRTGREISGLEASEASGSVAVFHAGTRREGDGRLVTAGGRVLGVTGTGATLREARRTAYDAVRLVKFSGMHFRTDIGIKGLRRLRRRG